MLTYQWLPQCNLHKKLSRDESAFWRTITCLPVACRTWIFIIFLQHKTTAVESGPNQNTNTKNLGTPDPDSLIKVIRRTLIVAAQCFTSMSGKGPFTSNCNLMHTEYNLEIYFRI